MDPSGSYHLAAVSCSLSAYRLGGVKLGFWLTGRLGRAWVGAWVVHGCVLPGLVKLGLGEGLDGDGEKVDGVVSCEMKKTSLTPPNL